MAIFLLVGLLTFLFIHGANRDIDRTAEDAEEMRDLAQMKKKEPLKKSLKKNSFIKKFI